MSHTQTNRHGLLPTPARPKGLPAVELTENGRQVLTRRYLRRGDDGRPVEGIEDMFWRVAWHVAKVEEQWGSNVMERATTFYHLLASKKFFPNSPTFTGAGTPLGQLAACFVLPISDDMGRRESGIFQTLRNAALIQQTGGGNGFSFSRLRPKGAVVKSSAGQATGPVGFLRVYDKAFGEIAQGGTRRGANMAVLRVDHPDIEEFITCKTDENAITNFNISVGITDAFMRAVENDEGWELRFPDVTDPRYRDFDGTLEEAERAGLPIRVYRKVRARELFEKIVRQAHHNGEPGVLFLDAANRSNPVPHLYQLESTNPCVTGDTLIYTDRGLRRADVLAAEGLPVNVVVDGRLHESRCLPATRVFPTGVRPVWRLLTQEGYELRLTGDHRVLTSRGWVAARDLAAGERVHLLNRKGGFGQYGSWEEGRRLGWLIGEATGQAVQAISSFLGVANPELIPLLAGIPASAVAGAAPAHCRPSEAARSGGHGVGRLVLEQRCDGVAAWPPSDSDSPDIPALVFASSEVFQRGFLQALFSADGGVQEGSEEECSVRLPSSHLPLLKDVQRLLLNFGIASRIRENRSGDGRKHELTIESANLIRFAQEIGFLTESEQSRLLESLSRLPHDAQEPFLATVLAVEPDGMEAVFDLHQPETHAFIANGLVVHNCGEQWLGGFENCCLGSINLNEHCAPDRGVDWENLRQSVETATRFLDDVVEANAYVPAVPQLKKAAHRARRIGLGIMGLADLMYHVGVRYGSEEGQEFASQVMEFIRYHAMRTSIELARERGAFPAIKGSIYDPEDLRWQPPKSIIPYRHDWGRPVPDWEVIVEGIRQHGIRNAATLTIAPTGTIATVAGIEGYGCEPVFALAYIRHVNDNGKDLQLTYASKRFEQALMQAGIPEAKRQEIYERVLHEGTCQHIAEVPEALRKVFVVASDVTAEEHVRMQAALQAFVDNSISKTINFPENATEEDVATAYLLAWKLGCKGLTVYVTGSREKVVLETKATAEKKREGQSETAGESSEPALPYWPSAQEQPTRNLAEAEIATQLAAWHETKKPRPRLLPGVTYRVETPLGRAFVTINENGDGQPFEVFINTAKAGSETAAVSEAIGRLISYVLRLASPIPPCDRLAEVVKQLCGIGGGRSLGFGAHRVRSLPDGVGQVLDEYLQWKTAARQEKGNGQHERHPAIQIAQASLIPGGSERGEAATTELIGEQLENAAPRQAGIFVGDLCPECGEASMVNEEGCRKCYSCGYSEC